MHSHLQQSINQYDFNTSELERLFDPTRQVEGLLANFSEFIRNPTITDELDTDLQLIGEEFQD